MGRRVGGRTDSPVTRVERRAVGVLSALVVAFGVWRVTIGVDFGDGAHVVALAQRMAQGDRPLVDEMNLQALGSVTAVPFTWVWLQLAGVEGIVLASRSWYILVALGCAVLAYRALRTRLTPTPALAAILFMLLPTPYSLLVTSYNSVPVLALGVATCCAFAALRGETTRPARWGALCGGALAVAVFSHPATIGAAAVLTLTAMVLAGLDAVRHRAVLLGLTGGAALVTLVLGTVVLLALGADAVRQTLDYTLAYQAERVGPATRLTRTLVDLREGLLVWGHLPAALLAVLAATGPRRWQGPAGACVVVALGIATALTALAAPDAAIPFASISPVFALLVVVFLLPPVLVWAVWDGDRDLGVLLVLTVPMALVGFTVMSLASSGSLRWGPAAPAFLPLAGVLVAAVVDRARRDASSEPADRQVVSRSSEVGDRRVHSRTAIATAVVLSLTLLGTHSLRTFRDPGPHRLEERIATGPMAGLSTRAVFSEEDFRLAALTTAVIAPDDGVLFYGYPAGYVYTTAWMDTNIIWLGTFGAANAATVRWLSDNDRWPDVVVVDRTSVENAGGWERLVVEDPLIDAVDRRYGPAVATGSFMLWRLDGTRPQPPSDS